MLQTHGPSGPCAPCGVTRISAVFWRRSSAFTFHSDLRYQASIAQPRAQPGQTDGVGFRYHTRALYMKSFASSAPTGQMSITLSE